MVAAAAHSRSRHDLTVGESEAAGVQGEIDVCLIFFPSTQKNCKHNLPERAKSLHLMGCVTRQQAVTEGW